MASGRIETLARALIECRGHILLCRNRAHGHAYLPGGHVEFGESASDALARELIEEAGLRGEVGPLVGVFELRFHQRSRERHELTLVFHVELPGAGEADDLPAVRSKEPEITFEWCPRASLSQGGLVPSQMLRWLESGSPRVPITWRSDDERGKP